jgi:hypothetical protein
MLRCNLKLRNFRRRNTHLEYETGKSGQAYVHIRDGFLLDMILKSEFRE